MEKNYNICSVNITQTNRTYEDYETIVSATAGDADGM